MDNNSLWIKIKCNGIEYNNLETNDNILSSEERELVLSNVKNAIRETYRSIAENRRRKY